ncbi:MAG: purine-nucleoside phosphorylase [Bacteroidota bacterium]
MNEILETYRYLQKQVPNFTPEIGIVLGTGLGALIDNIEIIAKIPYGSIPNFPIATVEAHKGKLIFGMLNGKKVVCMQGRFHFYEGYSMQKVTFGIRVMKLLGIGTLIVSNAAGGLNPAFEISDLMIIQDHISLFLPQNPLIGHNFDSLGDRFPDMSEPYHPDLIQDAENIASKNNLRIQKGVYVSVSGPQLETKAEYKLLRQLGADAVGMSTVPEIIVARHMGINCFGLSVITDLCIPETLQKAEFENIVAAARAAEPSMSLIISGLVGQI